MASERPNRKAIPLRVKLDAALIALGLDPKATEFDHDPALGLRPVNAAGDDFDPPQLDPRHIVPRAAAVHYAKTNGHRPGEKLVTTANSDKGRIAKAERLEAARIFAIGYSGDAPEGGVIAEARARGIPAPKPWPKGRKMQGRPFPKKAKPNG